MSRQSIINQQRAPVLEMLTKEEKRRDEMRGAEKRRGSESDGHEEQRDSSCSHLYGIHYSTVLLLLEGVSRSLAPKRPASRQTFLARSGRARDRQQQRASGRRASNTARLANTWPPRQPSAHVLGHSCAHRTFRCCTSIREQYTLE